MKNIKGQPDSNGHFGKFGGRYVGETLMPAILGLEKAYYEICAKPEFMKQDMNERKYYALQYCNKLCNTVATVKRSKCPILIQCFLQQKNEMLIF